MVAAVLQRASAAAKDEPESYVAAFEHAQERPDFLRLVSTVDRNLNDGSARPEHEPQFFSENMAGLSTMFQTLRSEKIVQKDEGERVLQTVTYEWSR